MHKRGCEDWKVGEVFETLSASFTDAQIVDFAMRYDPQTIHIDLEAAKEGPFSGLIASGFQTLALAFRLFLDRGFYEKSIIVGPGLDELRWTAPVRPGDTLKNLVHVLEVTPSRSQPDSGSSRLKLTTVTQKRETAVTALAA